LAGRTAYEGTENSPILLVCVRTMTQLLHKEVTRIIIGVYYNVYNGTSRTYPEFIYENAMMQDLREQNIPCLRQPEYQIFYKDNLIGAQRLDLFVAGDVVVELKRVPELTRLHKAQTISYCNRSDGNSRIKSILKKGDRQPLRIDTK
jgi:GxxExxY protein